MRPEQVTESPASESGVEATSTNFNNLSLLLDGRADDSVHHYNSLIRRASCRENDRPQSAKGFQRSSSLFGLTSPSQSSQQKLELANPEELQPSRSGEKPPRDLSSSRHQRSRDLSGARVKTSRDLSGSRGQISRDLGGSKGHISSCRQLYPSCRLSPGYLTSLNQSSRTTSAVSLTSYGGESNGGSQACLASHQSHVSVLVSGEAEVEPPSRADYSHGDHRHQTASGLLTPSTPLLTRSISLNQVTPKPAPRRGSLRVSGSGGPASGHSGAAGGAKENPPQGRETGQHGSNQIINLPFSGSDHFAPHGFLSSHALVSPASSYDLRSGPQIDGGQHWLAGSHDGGDLADGKTTFGVGFARGHDERTTFSAGAGGGQNILNKAGGGGGSGVTTTTSSQDLRAAGMTGGRMSTGGQHAGRHGASAGTSRTQPGGGGAGQHHQAPQQSTSRSIFPNFDSLKEVLFGETRVGGLISPSRTFESLQAIASTKPRPNMERRGTAEFCPTGSGQNLLHSGQQQQQKRKKSKTPVMDEFTEFSQYGSRYTLNQIDNKANGDKDKSGKDESRVFKEKSSKAALESKRRLNATPSPTNMSTGPTACNSTATTHPAPGKIVTKCSSAAPPSSAHPRPRDLKHVHHLHHQHPHQQAVSPRPSGDQRHADDDFSTFAAAAAHNPTHHEMRAQYRPPPSGRLPATEPCQGVADVSGAGSGDGKPERQSLFSALKQRQPFSAQGGKPPVFYANNEPCARLYASESSSSLLLSTPTSSTHTILTADSCVIDSKRFGGKLSQVAAAGQQSHVPMLHRQMSNPDQGTTDKLHLQNRLQNVKLKGMGSRSDSDSGFGGESANRSDLKIKQISLETEYDLIQLVGEGWFSKVYLAEHRNTRDEVVLKAINCDLVTGDEFYREYQSSLFLSAHKNILKIFDVVFQCDGYYMFATEYAPLGDLTSNITEQGLGEVYTKRVVRQIGAALDFIHSKNLCHLDVKLDNILVFRSDFSMVKLCDFGSVRTAGDIVIKKNELLPYCPAELVAKHANEYYQVDRVQDVFQFGIVGFFCLLGILPWQKADPTDPHFNEFVQWRRKRSSKIPRNFKWMTARSQKLFRKLLDPNPEKRLQLSELPKYLEDKWIRRGAKSASDVKGSVADHLSQLTLGSFQSVHSNAMEKNRMLYTLLQHGVETTVDRRQKTHRIINWIKQGAEREGSISPDQSPDQPGHHIVHEAFGGAIEQDELEDLEPIEDLDTQSDI